MYVGSLWHFFNVFEEVGEKVFWINRSVITRGLGKFYHQDVVDHQFSILMKIGCNA